MLILETPPGREAARKYVAGLVAAWLGVEIEVRPGTLPPHSATVRISRPDGGRGPSVTMPDLLFSTKPNHWLTAESLPSRPVQFIAVPQWMPADRLDDRRLPIIYGRSAGSETPIRRASDGSIELSADILGSIFFCVTRYEELIGKARDAHDRFPASASIAGSEDFLRRPVVDEYLELLRAALETTWPGVCAPATAGSVVVTHDIDLAYFAQTADLRQLGRTTAADLLKRRAVGLASRRVTSWVRARAGRYPHGDPYATYDRLMDLSEAVGVKSQFYFMTDVTDARMDARYSIDEPWIGRVLRRIGERGHTIGLHGSYGAFDRPLQVRLEFERLQTAASRAGIHQDRWAGRQHFLRWRNPITWSGWDAAGLDEDSTLMYPEVLGFRCGTTRPFQAFDLLEDHPLRLVERPLGIMDATLFSYLDLAPNDAAEVAIRHARRSRRYGGDLVVLWHNNNLVSREQIAAYTALLEAITRS